MVTAAHSGSIRWLCVSEQCRSSLSLMYLPQHSFSQSFINNLIRVSWFTRRYYAHEYSPSSRSCALAIAELSESSPVRTSCHRCNSTFYSSLSLFVSLFLRLLHVKFHFQVHIYRNVLEKLLCENCFVFLRIYDGFRAYANENIMCVAHHANDVWQLTRVSSPLAPGRRAANICWLVHIVHRAEERSRGREGKTRENLASSHVPFRLHWHHTVTVI